MDPRRFPQRIGNAHLVEKHLGFVSKRPARLVIV